MKSFTIEQIRKYIESQDSLGDVLYNLSEEKILLANKIKVRIIEREEEDDWGYDFEFEDGSIQEDVSNSYEGAEEIAEELGLLVVNNFHQIQ